MIASFACSDTEKLFYNQSAKRFHSIIRSAQRKLKLLNSASNINDLRSPPGNKLESLKGDRADQHSIRINDQWRICFTWHDGNAHNVEIVDYH
ncbi:MAG: type II toxin-antitoxin system RelE/ParE family toxin [Rickettsia hoogstraalii]|uniref:type II toxin-antitoxin system RelE/ParE family toxin n=1 Tax=Rickettsia hoogstraalii TaxID=467174 RepID=UPI00058C7762|nr:type II toxin-antitoxin system RelE/ParE family toxin [Rickettsia hoogstraalii]KJV81255.1 plasmid maintenance system killer family protein [Rickettsia hoogstraalii str. RCCE3]